MEAGTEKVDNALIAGTSVLTLDGALPVDILRPGDRIVTRDAGAVQLAEIRTAWRRLALVRFDKRLCGSATVLPARQQVLIRDWRAYAFQRRAQALIVAQDLLDHAYIRFVGCKTLPVVSLHFEAPHIVYAGGLELAAAAPMGATA